MKNTNIFFITVAILSLGFLAGCETVGQLPSGEKTTNETATVQDTQANQKEDKQVNLPTATAAADQAAYNGAMQLQDESYCATISDEQFKTKCQTDLADRIVQKDALAQKDPVLCDKLSTEDLKTACRTKLETEQKAAEKEDALQKETAETEALMQTALDQGNIAECQTIASSTARFDCEFNILLNNALNTQDKLVCQEASSDALRQACELDYDRQK